LNCPVDWKKLVSDHTRFPSVTKLCVGDKWNSDQEQQEMYGVTQCWEAEIWLKGSENSIHSFISIQPLGGFGRNQSLVTWLVWLWSAASWANFLGVGCHYFPLLLDISTFAARCLHVRNNARDPNSQRWNCGRECCPVILLKWQLPHHLGIFYMLQIYDMRTTALAGFEPANLGTKGQNATPRPPKFLPHTYKSVAGTWLQDWQLPRHQGWTYRAPVR
jgi:hypothetical protein